MNRSILTYLNNWGKSNSRKPAILRGARQVGKTYVIREFGKGFRHYFEFNFEETPNLKDVFKKDLNPVRILQDLGVLIRRDIPVSPDTLLFFDEVQTCEQVITALRYFYEKLPQIPVIAAGSLLDFAIEKVGVPVGRVEFMYLYPLSFLEFLDATDREYTKRAFLGHHDPAKPVSDVLHDQLLTALGEYLAVGGMPEVVARWASTRSLESCVQIQKDILVQYEQDFSKYAKTSQFKYLDLVFRGVPVLLSKKFVFSRISQEIRARELKEALLLLQKAGVIHVIHHSSGNGVPLGGECNLSRFKVGCLDVGLAQAQLVADTREWILHPKEKISNLGPWIEAFVGQEFLAYNDPGARRSLYYWHREQAGATAEVDYLIERGSTVIPCEVKAGTARKLKSLYRFLEEKSGSPFGLFFSLGNFRRHEYQSKPILGFPLYGVGRLSDLLKG